VHQFEMEMRVQVNFNMQLMLRTAGDRVYLHIKTLVIKMGCGLRIEGGGLRVDKAIPFRSVKECVLMPA